MDNHEVNIDSSIWGPHAWFFLDTVALAYPEHPTSDQIIQYKNFFNALEFVLPCAACRYHYKQYLTQHPLTLKVLNDKSSFIGWLLSCHNNVRQKQHKPVFTLQEFYNFYNENCCMNLKPEKKEQISLSPTAPTTTSQRRQQTWFYWVLVATLIAVLFIFLVIASKNSGEQVEVP